VHVVAGGVMTQVAIIMKSVITSFEELGRKRHRWHRSLVRPERRQRRRSQGDGAGARGVSFTVYDPASATLLGFWVPATLYTGGVPPGEVTSKF